MASKQKPTLTATEKVTLEAGHSPWAHAKILVDQNPDQYGPDKPFHTKQELYEGVLQFLLTHNTYVDRTGHVYTCDDHKTNKKYSGPLKYKGEELLIPQGFKFEDAQKCRIINVPVKPDPKPEPQKPVKFDIPLDTVVADAQFTPSRTGAKETAVAVDMFGYYYGTPPIRAAVRGSDNPDKIKRGALQPGEVEGQHVKLKARDEKSGAIAPGEAGTYEFGRANHYELRFRPSATWHIDPETGRPTGPNKHFSQKVEENARFVMDAEGRAIPSIDMGALISVKAKQNPYFRSIFTDFDTAQVDRSVWATSADGIKAMLAFRVTTDTQQTLGDRFKAKATLEDADKLLSTTAQLGMSPVVWTVGSYNTPRQKAETEGAVMDTVLNDPRLSEADRATLHAKYDGARAAIANPYQLVKEIKAKGIDQYIPTDEPVRDRAQEKVVWSGYYDGLGRHQGSLSQDDKKARSEAYGHVAARNLQREGLLVVPDEVNRALATGITADKQNVYDVQRQSAGNMDRERLALGKAVVSDDKLLDDAISHTMANPGRMQKMTDQIFYASIKRAKDNKTNLDFKSDDEADKFADRFGVALAGPEFKDKLDYKGRSIFSGIINHATLDIVRPNANRNQTRGLVDFPEAAREKWEHGTDEEKNQIRGAYREWLNRAISAGEKGKPMALAAFTTALDPHEDLQANGGKHSPQIARIGETSLEVTAPDGTKTGTLKAKTVLLDHLVQREAATAQIGAEVERAREQATIEGKKGLTARTPQELAALAAAVAAADGVGGKVLADIGAPGGARVAGTVFNLDRAKQAADALKSGQAGAGAFASSVISTADNASMVSQSQTDQSKVKAGAAASPVLFSLVALKAISETAGNKDAQKNAASYLQQLDHGARSPYADLMKHHANALKAAAGNPAATNAALNAAATELQAFFASSEGKNAGLHAGAANALAAKFAGDSLLAGAYGRAYNNTFALLKASDSKLKAGEGEVTLSQLFAGLVDKGVITNQQLANFEALKATGTPEAIKAAQDEMFAAYKAGIGELNGKTGVSYVDAIRNALIGYGLTGGSPNPDVINGGVPQCGTACVVPRVPTFPNLPSVPGPSPIR
ncbi:MAG: hypothetical protein ACKVOE_05850 [Rickettsiales bacterium]